MDLETLRNYLLTRPGCSESLPFDDDSPVYKVGGKIFAIVSLNEPHSFNVKCDPERAVELREKYRFVKPGYHMNKKHWNTVELTDGYPDSLFFEWIDHSYQLIVKGLTKAVRDSLPKQ